MNNVRINDIPVPASGYEPLQDAAWCGTRLGISAKKVRQLADAGTIPALKVGGRYRFLPSAIDSWILQQINGGR